MMTMSIKQEINDPSRTIPPNRRSNKKTVQFVEFVDIVHFEKASPTEAQDIWFTASELSQSQSEGIQLVRSYNQQCLVDTNNTRTEQQQQQHRNQPQPSSPEGQQSSISIDYRGLENYTMTRRTYKLVSIRRVLHAANENKNNNKLNNKRHGNDMEIAIAAEYQQYNKWSRKVAFVQAIHDYIDVYYDVPITDEKWLTRMTLLKKVPVVSSMVPPPLSSSSSSSNQDAFVTNSKRKYRQSCTNDYNSNEERDGSAAKNRRVRQRVVALE